MLACQHAGVGAKALHLVAEPAVLELVEERLRVGDERTRVGRRLLLDGCRQLHGAVVGVDDPVDVPAELQPQPEVAVRGGPGHAASLRRPGRRRATRRTISRMVERVAMDAQLQALLDRGEEHSCLEYSEVDGLVEALELDDEQVEDLYEEIERRGIGLRDDCGRAGVEPTTFRNGELAAATTDALQLFLNEIRRYSLLTAAEEIDLSKRIEQGDLGAKERMINSNLRLVVSIAKKYQGQELSLLGPGSRRASSA